MQTKLTRSLATLMLGVVLSLQVQAQDGVVTYQGLVQSGGNRFTGTGQFKFALVTATSGLEYTTHWSNDGTSVDGSEPTDAVAVPVEDGLFAVRLGDDSVANMTPLSASLFQLPDLRLRIWFDDGVNGFAGLSPTQPLTASPYAMQAATVNAGGIAGTIGSAQIASGAVTSGKLAAGSVGATEIDITEVQRRVTGTAPGGSYITGINSDGSVTTSPIGPGWKLDGNGGTSPGAQFLGTTDDQALELKVNNQRALRLSHAAGAFTSVNLLGGYSGNTLGSGTEGATIAGGGRSGSVNSIGADADYTSIGGGYGNSIAKGLAESTISGGGLNSIGAGSSFATVGGGHDNDIAASASSSTIAGGFANNISGNLFDATIGGGAFNKLGESSGASAIGGGTSNEIGFDSDFATIGGGNDNTIGDTTDSATIAGGFANTIGTNSFDSTIGGGAFNLISHYSPGSVIAGGSSSFIGNSSERATVSGGRDNNINSDFSTIGGGDNNRIGSLSYGSVIAGGVQNIIDSLATNSTVVGGYQNVIRSYAPYSIIGGGRENVITGSRYSVSGEEVGSSTFATVAGGAYNKLDSSTSHSTIGGGYNNWVQLSAFGSTIAGGQDNTAQTNSSRATIGGGSHNRVMVRYATVPGGYSNSAAESAFAAGTRAKAIHRGAFVWGDDSNADISSAANDSVTMRASGGYRLFSNSGATAGVLLAAGGTAWGVISDRNMKKDFAPVDGKEVLEKLAAMPITRWHYHWEDGETTPHIGPMAQDFKAAFYPGADDKVITTQEADGVALAAIQGLNEKVERGSRNAEVRTSELERRLRERENEITELKQQLGDLKALVEALAQRK